MGVIGLDLRCSGIGGMPRKLGWPRQQSKHTLNANEKQPLTTAHFDAAIKANPIAPMGGFVPRVAMAPVLAPIGR